MNVTAERVAPELRLEGVRLAVPGFRLEADRLAVPGFRLEADLVCSDWPLVVLGPSGAGKSLLVRVLAGFEKPDAGRIAFAGDVWCDRSGGEGSCVPVSRRPIGCCSQAPRLFPHRDALWNVEYPLGNLRPRPTREDRRARALAELQRWGAGSLARARVERLSGGEQGRVAIARAFVARPALLLLDEPFAALDPPAREELLAVVRQEWRALGTPAVWVTHDRAEALTLGGTMAVLLAGRIAQVGAPEEVFRMPASPEVASFVGMGTVLHGFVQAREGGVMRLRCGGAVLYAAGTLPPGTPVVASIRSEEVELHSENALAERRQRTSARNELPAVVTGIRPIGLAFSVDLDAGFRLSAAVTRPALEELRLEPGTRVVAHVKALGVGVRSEAWSAPGTRSG